jgi:hypothetical protein
MCAVVSAQLLEAAFMFAVRHQDSLRDRLCKDNVCHMRVCHLWC